MDGDDAPQGNTYFPPFDRLGSTTCKCILENPVACIEVLAKCVLFRGHHPRRGASVVDARQVGAGSQMTEAYCDRNRIRQGSEESSHATRTADCRLLVLVV